MSNSVRLPGLMLLLACGLLIVLGILILFPGRLIQPIDVNGASGYFAADRRAVAAYGECVQVEWSVQNISAVYFNDQGTTGINTQVFCLQTTQTARLRVVFLDGHEQTYTLTIDVLIDRPEVWIAVTLFIVSCGLALITALVGRRSMSATVTTAFQRLLMGLGGFVVLFVWTFLLLEIILRLYFGIFGTEDQRIAYVYTRDQIDQLQASNLPLPTVDSALNPANIGVNSLGYRGDEIAIPKPDGVYRIVAAGGSNTFGLYVPPSEAYPAQLQQVLREEYGYTNVEVVNAGISGTTSFQIMANMATRYLELDPDLVIYFESTNDVHTRERAPDCYAGMNPLRGLNPMGLIATYQIGAPLLPSTLLRFFSIRLGYSPDPSTIGTMYTEAPVECGEGQMDYSNTYVSQNPPTYFRRNLITMAGIAEIHEFRFLPVTWAFHYNARNLDPVWRDAVAEHNQVIRDLAQDYQLPLLDYANEAPQDEQYWQDYEHMNADGLHLQAEDFAAFIAAQGWIPHP